jgi:hypothetical protein
MIERKKIIQRALTTALQIRQKAKVPLTDSLCIFDFAEANGIDEVHFFNIPSLEEVYWKQARKIIVSSVRPPAGRLSTAPTGSAITSSATVTASRGCRWTRMENENSTRMNFWLIASRGFW